MKYEKIASYKYRLLEPLSLECSITGISARNDYVTIWDDGRLILAAGYPWDGPSGPTIDTADSIRASAGHDALYQLIGLGVIPADRRILADRDLRRWCIEDGMPAIRADAWYHAVRCFGGLHVK